uniref:Gamma-glutamylcyclotransferase family protein n=1 Tax=Kalanchoe fedtschenkoi TaxID=63787 RepID=A0A7N0TAE1_KALFE
MVVDGGGADTVLIFTYGTLKQGFSNHSLMQDLIRRGDAAFVARCRTRDRHPLVCGPYRVPFLLDLAGSGERVWGEVYEVGREGLARMDELEGTGKGHYERRPIAVVADGEGERDDLAAEAYFAHPSYAMGLWRKSGEVGYEVYSSKEARGYVKRMDRPRNLTFLQQIDAFIAQSDS